MSTREDRQRRLSVNRGVVKPRQLAHVVRRTARFDELVRWYCTVLGAEVVHSDGVLAFLTYDDEHHRIAIASIPGLEEQPMMAAGTDHIAFSYADLGDLLHTFRCLKAAGIEPYWCINRGPTTSLYYKDPDGNRVELQVDSMPSARAIDAWMRSGEFSANPIGVIFDPEELVARYEAGEPIETLTARPPLPEGTGPVDMLRF
ncbi:MAG: VOC family protein [Deltaproteobacteria bacterium]|nr:VOC family protein [Deltaproteobacteria bacterium]MBI3388648.1 VOC family protein [Deltaproteobacteria bacterium]